MGIASLHPYDRYTFAISRHDVPEACLKFALSNQRAQGMPGAG
ncbi:hypothetical protein V1279_003235 [Bradyrhizobium sp. AZCC 1610]